MCSRSCARSSVAQVWLGVLALEPMRTHDPQEAIGHGHSLQIGLVLSPTGQVQQSSQREVMDFAEAQDLAIPGVEPAQTVQAAGFVAGDPEPVAGEGRT